MDLLTAVYFFFQVVGALYVFVKAIALTRFFLDKCAPGVDLRHLYGALTASERAAGDKQAPWAVVSGATDGIGKAFCHELADRGLNVCLLARNAEKAAAVARELRAGVKTKTVIIDFAHALDSGYVREKLAQELEGLDVCVLVNNVGICDVGRVLDVRTSYLDQCVSVNCASTVLVTKVLLPQLMRRARRSAIINLSSVYGEFACPYNAVYSATKAFLDKFSRAVATEVSTKIDVMSLKPLMVLTAMNSSFSRAPGALTPRECARGALLQLGREKSTNGHIIHRLQDFFLNSAVGRLYFDARVLPRLKRTADKKVADGAAVRSDGKKEK